MSADPADMVIVTSWEPGVPPGEPVQLLLSSGGTSADDAGVWLSPRESVQLAGMLARAAVAARLRRDDTWVLGVDSVTAVARDALRAGAYAVGFTTGATVGRVVVGVAAALGRREQVRAWALRTLPKAPA